MPRLTNATYLSHRKTLAEAWKAESPAWARLVYREQMDLHQFFAPSKTMSDSDAIAYRDAITKQQPGLPSQAGRAFAEFARVMAYYRKRREAPVVKTERPRRRRSDPQHIVVAGLARPDIDFRALAKAILMMALEAQRREQESDPEKQTGDR